MWHLSPCFISVFQFVLKLVLSITGKYNFLFPLLSWSIYCTLFLLDYFHFAHGYICMCVYFIILIISCVILQLPFLWGSSLVSDFWILFYSPLMLDHQKSKRVPGKHLFLLYWLCQSPWLCGYNKLWKILKEIGIPDHLACLLRNLYVGQEATVRTGHGTTDWFPNRKRSTSRLYIVTLLI